MSQTMLGSPYLVVSGSPAGLGNLPPVLRQIAGRLIPGQLVDRIDNFEEILIDAKTSEEAAKFLPVYRGESRLLLEALAGTHAELEAELLFLIESMED